MKKRLLLLVLLLPCLLSAIPSKTVLGFYEYGKANTYPAEAINFNKVSIIAHSFITPISNGQISVPSTFLYPELITRAHANNVKVIVSAGGGNFYVPFKILSKSTVYRQTFASNLRRFCETNQYDGVDIDWEFPNTMSDRTNFTLMMKTIKTQFSKSSRPLILTADFSGGDYWGQWFDVVGLLPYLDFINIMSYSYHGSSWCTHAGHNSPLYISSLDLPWHGGGTYDFHNAKSFHDLYLYWLYRTAPKNKLLMGLAFTGHNVEAENMGDASPIFPETGFSYHDILTKIGNGWTEYWDAEARVPYLKNDALPSIISYENPQSLIEKCNYVNASNIAGVIIWALGQDYKNETPLLDAVAFGFTKDKIAVKQISMTPSVISNDINNNCTLSLRLKSSNGLVTNVTADLTSVGGTFTKLNNISANTLWSKTFTVTTNVSQGKKSIPILIYCNSGTNDTTHEASLQVVDPLCSPPKGGFLIYSDATNKINYAMPSAHGGFSKQTNNGPYEGRKHYFYNFDLAGAWWDSAYFDMCNWSPGLTLDVSGATHLRIAYKTDSAVPTLTLALMLRTYTNATTVRDSYTISLPKSLTYKITNIPIAVFTNRNGTNHVSGLNKFAGFYWRVGGAASGTGKVYFDNMLFVMPLKSPTPLILTAQATNRIALGWTDVADETGYKIYRGMSNGFAGASLLSYVPANMNSYMDSTLLRNTKYFYFVRATNEMGISSYASNSATTLASNINVIGTGLPVEKDNKVIMVQPNAADPTARFYCYSKAKSAMIEVYTILGDKIWSSEIINVGAPFPLSADGTKFLISASWSENDRKNIPSGNYLVLVKEDGVTKKGSITYITMKKNK